MIGILDSENKKDFLKLCGSADIFACRISCLYESYSEYEGIVDFWVQYNENGTASSVISKYSSAVTAFCTDGADTGELENFVNAVGFSSFECNLPVLSDRPSGVIMKLDRNLYSAENIEQVSINTSVPDYKSIYRLLDSCRSESFTVPSYEDFLIEFSHRLRHGTSQFCCIEKDGIPLAFAMTAAISANTALIGSVCTAKNARCHGFGGACVCRLIEMSGEREIYIIRAENENESFYSNLGFKNAGDYFCSIREL